MNTEKIKLKNELEKIGFQDIVRSKEINMFYHINDINFNTEISVLSDGISNDIDTILINLNSKNLANVPLEEIDILYDNLINEVLKIKEVHKELLRKK